MVSMTGHHVLNNEVIRGSNFDEVRNTCNPYSDALLMTTEEGYLTLTWTKLHADRFQADSVDALGSAPFMFILAF